MLPSYNDNYKTDLPASDTKWLAIIKHAEKTYTLTQRPKAMISSSGRIVQANILVYLYGSLQALQLNDEGFNKNQNVVGNWNYTCAMVS